MSDERDPPAWALAMEQRLEARVEELAAGLHGALNRARGDIMARIDRLQEALVATQEGGVVELGVAERAERQVKALSAIVEIQGEQIIALRRIVLRLQSRIDGAGDAA